MIIQLSSRNLLAAFITATFVFAAPAFGQRVEDGWKGILPFKTDRESVNLLLGAPEVDDNGYYGYKTAEAFVRINYSSGPCAPDAKHPGIDRGKYNVPLGTVLDYYVVLKKTVIFQELQLDVKKFYRDTSGDVTNVARYYEYLEGSRVVTGQNGVSVGVSVQGDIEYVSTIEYYPRRSETEAVKCKSH